MPWVDSPARAALIEALVKRGHAPAKLIELKRLPNGTFAPKGSGMVLKPGMKVSVPHKSGSGTVEGTVKAAGQVTLDGGPDKGSAVSLSPAPPASPGTGSDKKLKVAWAAHDKKHKEFQDAKAEFDKIESPTQEHKKDLAKKAAQLRAAKWSIKRAGGDPTKPPSADAPSDFGVPSSSQQQWLKTAAEAGDKYNFAGAMPSGQDAMYALEKQGMVTISGKMATVTDQGKKYLGDDSEPGSIADEALAVKTKQDNAAAEKKATLKAADEALSEKPKVKSYDPKTGPSDEEKAKNAATMHGSKPVSKKPKLSEEQKSDKLTNQTLAQEKADQAKQKPDAKPVYHQDNEGGDVQVGGADGSGLAAKLQASIDSVTNDTPAEKPEAEPEPEPVEPAPKDDAPAEQAAAPESDAPISPHQAALDAYKAAGGDDPTIIGILEQAIQASSAQPEAAPQGAEAPAPAAQAAPPADPATQAAPTLMNQTGVDLEHMKPGQSFAMNDGTQWQYHKPTEGGVFHVVKPLGGGKAKVFHGKMQPPMIGPTPSGDAAMPETPEAAAPTGSLYDKLKASVDAVQTGSTAEKPESAANLAADSDKTLAGGSTATATAPPEAAKSLTDSPGRGPTGKLRNFKAMSVAKLQGVVMDLKSYGDDQEALAAALDALAKKQ